MKLSQGLQSFWTMTLGYLAIATAVSVFVGMKTGLVQAAIALAILLLIGQALLGGLKQQIVQSAATASAVNPIDLATLSPASHPTLEQQIVTLEGLGFQRVMAYRCAPAAEAQVFAHPEERCFVEVGVIPASDTQATMNHTVIVSLLEQDWKLASINRLPQASDSMGYIWRNAKTVVRYNAPNQLTNVLHNHLRVRQQMTSDLNIAVSTDISADAYRAMLEQNRTHMLRTLERKNFLLSMLEATGFELKPKPIWLGDYGKVAKAV
jgi:hypothetical protein